MATIKKNLKFVLIQSVMRNEENPLVNDRLQDVIVTKKPRNDNKTKDLIIDALNIEPDFKDAIMIIGIEPVTKTYEMDIETFIANATEVEDDEEEEEE